MSDQSATPMQEVERPAEAGFSTNMYLNHPVMGRLQFTFRGATSRDWGTVLMDVDNFAHYMKDKGWYFDGAKPQAAPAAAQPPDPGEPVYEPIDDSGHGLPPILSVTVERISVKVEDGRFFHKVMGGKFTQYGIAVWPEVLEAANLPTKSPTMPSINGWIAEYIETVKDGQTRRKVTRLLPPRRTRTDILSDDYEGVDPRNGMPFGDK